MGFDWYQATVPEDFLVIVDGVMALLPGAKEIKFDEFGGNGYKGTARFIDASGDTISTLLFNSKSAAPNLRGTGKHSAPIAKLVRELWPEHTVSRLDVCEDLSEAGFFEKTVKTLKSIASEHKIESGRSFIPDIAEKGSTYYLGAPKSQTMIRCYEKGKELLAKGECTPEEYDPNHVRVEIQCRPKTRDAKSKFASIEPDAVWGVSAWSQNAADQVLGLKVPRVKIRENEKSDLDQANEHLTFQWSRHIFEMGTRLALINDGNVDPSAEEIVQAWCNHTTPAFEQNFRRYR